MSMHDCFSKKLIGMIVLSTAIFFTASMTVHGAVFAPNNDIVACAPYEAAEMGDTNWRGFIPSEFLTVAQKHRIRQNGDIESLGIYLTAASSNPWDFKVRIWRQDENGKFDMVGTSGNLTPHFDSGPGYYNISLDQPISVKEGDFIGYYLDSQDYVFHANINNPASGNTYRIGGSLEGSQNIDFIKGYESSYTARFCIDTYMQAPSFVFIGDSITQGAPNHRSFLVDTLISGMEGTIPYQFSELNGYSYQNMGIGSQTSAMIAARFQKDVVDLKPRAAVILAGVNDIAQGVSLENYVTNMTTMLDLCEDNDIIPVVVKILPWTNGNYSQMLKWEEFNAALESLIGGYEDGVLVDASSFIGQERASGSEGNLWNIKPEYNVDGVHLNKAGHGMVALAIQNALIPEPSAFAMILIGLFCVFAFHRNRH